jgi:hypothetical protein
MVMDTRRVDGVERELLDTRQCQERCINTLSQRLCFLLSKNLTEKVILNLTDCDSLWVLLSMHQHIVMSLALVELNFLWETMFPPLYLRNTISTHNAV